MRKGNPHGQCVNTSHSGGLSVREAWAALFVANEDARKRCRFGSIRTDEELVCEMMRMFPDRWETCLMYQVARVRAAFNRRHSGGWFRGIGGDVKAKRYAKRDGAVYVASAHGKPKTFLGICNETLAACLEKDENEKR